MMTRRTLVNALSAIAGISLASLGAGGSEATDMTADIKKMNTMPLPRDPEIAVREEYDLALAAGTKSALELFIARHADHPLAAEAEARLKALGK